MNTADQKINEARRLHDLAKSKYIAELSSEQRDPAVVSKLRFEMDAALKHFVDSTNDTDPHHLLS